MSRKLSVALSWNRVSIIYCTLGIRYHALRRRIAADILSKTFACASAGNDQKAPNTALGGGPVNHGQLCFKCSYKLLRSGTCQRKKLTTLL